MLDQAALAEIKSLQRDNARLTPVQLIEQSRSANSALHRYFTWDDTEAAHAFRVIQARQVLRVVIRLQPKPAPQPLKVIASSPSRVAPTQAVIVQKPLAGFEEDIRRLLVAIEVQRTSYVSGPEMDAVFAEIYALLRTKVRSDNTFGGASRDANGTLSRFKPYTHGSAHTDRAAASLPSTHDAVVGARTLFPTRVFSAAASEHVFVAGHNNAKIGDFVTKGPWAGLNIFTLTLEERATCPKSCDLWHECLAPGTPVLTADLRWVPIESLTVGDRIAAFDEQANDSYQHRMTRIASVENVGRARLSSYRITTDRGTVVASSDHLWLRRRTRLSYKWRPTSSLKVGDKLQYFGDPWETDTSYDAGRLRGFVEGEGYCCTFDNNGFAKTRIGWSQRPTKLCDEIIEVAGRLGFKTYRYEQIAGVAQTAISHIDIAGGWRENAAFLGRIRPTRMIEKAEDAWLQHDIGGRGGRYATVLAVELIGDADVITIRTSTQTLVAGGFFTHNCYGNAMPLAKRWAYDEHLPEAICDDIEQKAKEHPVGFIVRLHILGDFPDVYYTELWQSLLRDTPQLHLFGYTAHPATSEIGRVIVSMNQEYPARCAIRFSVSPEMKPGPMQATTIWRKERAQVPEGLVCPASSGDTEACGTCGLCWHPSMAKQRIVFLGHGMSRGRTTKLAPPGVEIEQPALPPALRPILRTSAEPPVLLPPREKVETPADVPVNRPCLRCKRIFRSKHIGNRLCNTCGDKS